MNLGNYLTYFKRLDGDFIFILLSYFFYARDSLIFILIIVIVLILLRPSHLPLLSTTHKS